MTLDATNVRIARTGAVYVAPLGTTLPTTTAGSLDSAFVDCGYVSTDGVTFTPSETVNGVFAWQNSARVATTREELTYTFQFVLIEDKGAVAKLWYRSSSVDVVQASEWSLTPDTQTEGRRAFVVDVVDGSKLKRFLVPQGEITERGDQVFVGSEPIGYDATVTCYYDSTLGAPFKVLSNLAVWGYS